MKSSGDITLARRILWCLLIKGLKKPYLTIESVNWMSRAKTVVDEVTTIQVLATENLWKLGKLQLCCLICCLIMLNPIMLVNFWKIFLCTYKAYLSNSLTWSQIGQNKWQNQMIIWMIIFLYQKYDDICLTLFVS